MADDRYLIVILAGRRAAVVAMSAQGRFALAYDEEYLGARNPTPLSLSMPLAQRDHGDGPVRAFLSGLLPDDDHVLQRWARTYQVSAGNPFALLGHIGEDCAGAAQLVRAERVDAVLAGEGDIQWLTSDDVAERLKLLRRDHTAWHPFDTGQFSLAGAQAKTALYYDPAAGRWGIPRGAIPTTHILKPAIAGLDDHDLNEHLCLRAASRLGLPVVSSHVERFGSQRVIVVDRYDRLYATGGSITRIHQEDMCQALGVPPTNNYQNEGGPAPEQIITRLRESVFPASAATGAVNGFVDALAYNWIIGGTDAHAKNYSVLLAGSQVRLAPLYDVASTLPYDDMHLRRLRLAMKIGGEYRLDAVNGRHWRRFAEANALDPEAVIARVADLAARTPDAFVTAANDKSIRALHSRLPAILTDRVATRAVRCREILTRG